MFLEAGSQDIHFRVCHTLTFFFKCCFLDPAKMRNYSGGPNASKKRPKKAPQTLKHVLELKKNVTKLVCDILGFGGNIRYRTLILPTKYQIT